MSETPCKIDLTLQRVVHGDTIAGPGQGVGQGGHERISVGQGIAQRADQRAQHDLDGLQMLVGEAGVAVEDDFAKVVVGGNQAVAAAV